MAGGSRSVMLPTVVVKPRRVERGRSTSFHVRRGEGEARSRDKGKVERCGREEEGAGEG